MNIFFLDDDKTRIEVFSALCPDAIIAETAPEAISTIENKSWDICFLDHDLGGEQFVESGREDTGAGVARWIVENKPKIDLIIVHSYNPDGAENMRSLLSQAGYNVKKIPFSDLMKRISTIINS
tara:strand:- start:2526 stop:2897 length:372 start_codon:yes stop_codon:yes gene_type:complete